MTIDDVASDSGDEEHLTRLLMILTFGSLGGWIDPYNSEESLAGGLSSSSGKGEDVRREALAYLALGFTLYFSERSGSILLVVLVAPSDRMEDIEGCLVI